MHGSPCGVAIYTEPRAAAAGPTPPPCRPHQIDGQAYHILTLLSYSAPGTATQKSVASAPSRLAYTLDVSTQLASMFTSDRLVFGILSTHRRQCSMRHSSSVSNTENEHVSTTYSPLSGVYDRLRQKGTTPYTGRQFSSTHLKLVSSSPGIHGNISPSTTGDHPRRLGDIKYAL